MLTPILYRSSIIATTGAAAAGLVAELAEKINQPSVRAGLVAIGTGIAIGIVDHFARRFQAVRAHKSRRTRAKKTPRHSGAGTTQKSPDNGAT